MKNIFHQTVFFRLKGCIVCQTGPVVYRSRTVFEDATPDIVRDFFWDDEFRPKWDFMLANFKTLEEDTQTGTMIVQWRKKVFGLMTALVFSINYSHCCHY